MAAVRCCSQEQLFQHQESGDTCCLGHSLTVTCRDCELSVEQCGLVGCGRWVCTDPLIALLLTQNYVNPPTHLH